MIFFRRDRKRDKPKNCTEIDKIAFEFLLPLGLLKLEGADIQSIRARVDIVADLGRPVNPADCSLTSVTPIQSDVLEETLKLGIILIHILQLTLIPLQDRQVFLRLNHVLRSRFCLQLRNLLCQALGGTDFLGNQRSRFVQHGLESTKPQTRMYDLRAPLRPSS